MSGNTKSVMFISTNGYFDVNIYKKKNYTSIYIIICSISTIQERVNVTNFFLCNHQIMERKAKTKNICAIPPKTCTYTVMDETGHHEKVMKLCTPYNST
jgi:hypothetical protein